MISYAQNFEDVILLRALKDVAQGFYIDIGAQHPILDSVSLAFYEAGWRGVSVEPSPGYAKMLREARPGDDVIEAAIGPAKSTIPFFEVPSTGLSTGVAAIARMRSDQGFPTRKIKVASQPLSALFDQYADREIHWLKIDCEGMEKAVIESWAPSNIRPWIVVVGSTAPGTNTPAFEAWEGNLLDLGYTFAYTDRLNRFYVSDAHLDLVPLFGPPNCFDDFQLSTFTQGFHAIGREVAAQQARLVALKREIETAEAAFAVSDNKRWIDLFERLDRTEISLREESVKRALSERLVADANGRLELEISRSRGLQIEIEDQWHANAHLSQLLAERQIELNRLALHPLWRTLSSWKRLKKNVARHRRKLLTEWGLRTRTQPASSHPAGEHDFVRVVMEPRPLLLRRADNVVVGWKTPSTTFEEA